MRKSITVKLADGYARWFNVFVSSKGSRCTDGSSKTTFPGTATSLSRTNGHYAWTGHVDVDRAHAANGLKQYAASGGQSGVHNAYGNLQSEGIHYYI